MSEPSDLDLRIGALSNEYQAQIAGLASRAATLAAELSSTQGKLKAAEARIAEFEAAKQPGEPNG